MIIIGIIACIAGVCALAWLLFNLAVFALPFFAGVSAGMAALHSGAGPVGAILVGLLVGALTLAVGQMVFTLVPSTLVRGAVALIVRCAVDAEGGAAALAQQRDLRSGTRQGWHLSRPEIYCCFSVTCWS